MKPHSNSLPAGKVILIGIVALAVAMGIGRFAFTPLLPLMLRDGVIDAAGGAEWAAANYVGYLIGAFSVTRFTRDPLRGLRLALAGVAATTLAVAWHASTALPAIGLALRAASGVFSAWTLVCASAWCLPELARHGRAHRGGWIYTGVGLGIALVGMCAWIGGRHSAAALWFDAGLLAAVAAAWAWRQLPPMSPVGAAKSATNTTPAARGVGQWGLVSCYGAFGFGYIVLATFLPAMAREQVSDPLVFGLTWPLFGAAAAASVAAVTAWLRDWPRIKVWALAQAVMALGTSLPLITRALWALAIAAVLVGGTFMVTTMAGLQLARERTPENPTLLLARMTTAFALGQIAGPLLVRLADGRDWLGLDALALANALATLLLGMTSVWLWRRSRENSFR